MCKNCDSAYAVELVRGQFKTDLFCSWDCLQEFIELEEQITNDA